jgi:hypothetical protein
MESGVLSEPAFQTQGEATGLLRLSVAGFRFRAKKQEDGRYASEKET